MRFDGVRVGGSMGTVPAIPAGRMLKSVCGIGISGVAVIFMIGFQFGNGRYRCGIIAFRYGWCACTPAKHAFRMGSLETRRAQPSYRMRCGTSGFVTLRVTSDVCGGGSVCTRDCVICFACVMGRFGFPQITPETHSLLLRGKRRYGLENIVLLPDLTRQKCSPVDSVWI